MEGDGRPEDVDCDDEDVARLLLDVGLGRLNRRELLYRGIVLGLSVPALGWLLATLQHHGTADA